MLEFEPFKEKKDDNGLPFAYLLRCVANKKSYCVISIENETPILSGRTSGSVSDMVEEGWENLTSNKASIEKYLIANLPTDDILQMENSFYEPEDNEDKLFIINNEE